MERVEEYLETIYDIQMKEKRSAKTGDIAKHLNIKPPSVTEMLTKLKEMGYVDYQPYKGAVLTREGEKIAKKIKRFHDLSLSFFKSLGIEDDVAEHLACELEHHLNDEIASRLCELVSDFCNACEECSARTRSLINAEDGEYLVIASPSSLSPLIKPGVVLKVIDGRTFIEELEINISETVSRFVVVKKLP